MTWAAWARKHRKLLVVIIVAALGALGVAADPELVGLGVDAGIDVGEQVERAE